MENLVIFLQIIRVSNTSPHKGFELEAKAVARIDKGL
jgi:hypothetical protein